MNPGHIRDTDGTTQYVLESDLVSIIAAVRVILTGISMGHKSESSKKSGTKKTFYC